MYHIDTIAPFHNFIENICWKNTTKIIAEIKMKYHTIAENDKRKDSTLLLKNDNMKETSPPKNVKLVQLLKNEKK